MGKFHKARNDIISVKIFVLQRIAKLTWRVDYSLEYENLEKFYLEFFLTSKISATVVSKKNDGNLEINLEKVNIEKVVGNLI